MKYTVRNLGPLKSAELSLRDLTIVCGKNNSGKTYLNYSLYSFLNYIRESRVFLFSENTVAQIMQEGRADVAISEIVLSYRRVCSSLEFMGRFGKQVARDLAVPVSRTEGSFFDFEIDKSPDFLVEEFRRSETCGIDFQMPEQLVVRISHQAESENVSVKCFPDQSVSEDSARNFFPLPERVMDDVYWAFSIFLQRYIFRAFYISCERNGVMTFGQEISIFNNVAFNGETRNIELIRNLRKRLGFTGYPLPVRREINFVMELFNIQRRRESFLVREYGEIIDRLDQIIGGVYNVSNDVGHFLTYTPRGQKKPLQISECSSSVKSLVELNYYLRYLARRNDLLIIDEPELDLHPSLHRSMAKLLINLVNAGIRVLLTTHSDYLVREINLMVTAYSDDPGMRSDVANVLHCNQADVISPKRVSCHVIGDGEIKPMKYIKDVGFPIISFDETIESFNNAKQNVISIICNEDVAKFEPENEVCGDE